MKLSKAVLLASGIGVSSQFSFGSISVSTTVIITPPTTHSDLNRIILGFGREQKEQAG